MASRSKKLALLGLSVICSLAAAECILQAHHRLSRGEWLSHAEAFRVPFVEPVPGRRAYQLRRSFSDSAKAITTDPDGFRSLGYTEPNVEKEPIVVFLGDSVPFGFGVRNEEAYPSQFHQISRSQGERIHVINAGVPSYTLWQSIDLLNVEVSPKYTPSLIVLHAANDVSLITYFRDQWKKDVTWSNVGFLKNLEPLAATDKFATIYYTKSAISRLLKGNLPGFQTALNNREHKAYEHTPMLQHVEFELSAFAKQCSENNIPLILLPVDPFYYQTAYSEKNSNLRLWRVQSSLVEMWKPIINDINTLLQRVSANNKGVHFLDTRPILDQLDRDELYLDFIHLTPAGNRYLAALLHQYVTEYRLLRKSAKLDESAARAQ